MQWNRKGMFGVVVLACLSSAAWSDPITIAPTTEDLYTVSSTVNIPGIGKLPFYSSNEIPTTNTDHIIALLAGGTLNAVGDSLTLPIQLRDFNLANTTEINGTFATGYLYSPLGNQPMGSITIDYTRANEGGTFTATLPVDLDFVRNYTHTNITFSDTLQITGNWSIFGPIWYPNPEYSLYPPNGFYIGDLDSNRQLFSEVGTDVNDIGYLAGPEPGTFGLFGVSIFVALIAVRKTRQHRGISS
jgi:hypothetical protein